MEKTGSVRAATTKKNDHSTKPDILCFSGSNANGKSTLRRICFGLLKPKNPVGIVLEIDMSEIINAWGARPQNGFAKLIAEQRQMMERGFYLPDEIAIPLFHAWFKDAVSRNPGLKFLALSGFPRTEEQLGSLRLFNRRLIVQTLVSKERALSLMYKRLMETSQEHRRKDDANRDTFDNRWEQFEAKTEPALLRLNGECCRIDGNQPLKNRISHIFSHLERMENRSPVQRAILAKAMNRFGDRNHEIAREVFAIDNPPFKAPSQPPMTLQGVLVAESPRAGSRFALTT